MRPWVLLVMAACGRIDFDEVSVRTGSFGDLQIGARHGQSSTDVLRVSVYPLDEAATPTQIVVAVDSLGATNPTRLRTAIYDLDASGLPRSLLIASSEVVVAPHQDPAWVSLPVTAPTLLSPGTYGLGMQASNQQLQYYYTVDPQAIIYGMDDYDDGPEPSFIMLSRDDRRLSIHADYQAR